MSKRREFSMCENKGWLEILCTRDAMKRGGVGAIPRPSVGWPPGDRRGTASGAESTLMARHRYRYWSFRKIAMYEAEVMPPKESRIIVTSRASELPQKTSAHILQGSFHGGEEVDTISTTACMLTRMACFGPTMHTYIGERECAHCVGQEILCVESHGQSCVIHEKSCVRCCEISSDCRPLSIRRRPGSRDEQIRLESGR